MDEVDREVRTLICPRCGGTLKGRGEGYAFVYVCDECGIIILDLKIKLKKGVR
jgi:tRNA(Ile2) C34 agmatinyltransferase TiaS